MSIHQFKTKKGNEAIIRYPTIDDLEQMTSYVNFLSAEDTFITFSGEVVTLEEEKDYLQKALSGIALGEKVMLVCEINKKIVAISDIDRYKVSRKRGFHTAIFGIAVAKEFRDEGIGFNLAKQVINEAQKNIKGLRIIRLNVYEGNNNAIEMYKRLGFNEYGRLQEGIWYKDNYIDEIYMSLSVSEIKH